VQASFIRDWIEYNGVVMLSVLAEYRSVVGHADGLNHVSFALLLARCRKGDDAAKRSISGALLRQTLRVAEDWSNSRTVGIDMDMIQQANAALWNSIDEFSGVRLDDFEQFLARRIGEHLEQEFLRGR
jgi:hypothetical protein